MLPQPPSPEEFLDALNKHLTIFNSHVQFLHTFSQKVKAEPSPLFNEASRNADDVDQMLSIEQMIQQATKAIHNTETCTKLYRDQSSNRKHASPARSPETTLAHRNKRASLPSTAQDDEAKPAKRRRSSRVHQNSTETWHDAAEHIATTPASPPNIPAASATAGNEAPHPQIEYDDISAEVEARLLAREQRRKLRHSQQQGDSNPTTIKRKRRSTLGDSILGTIAEGDVNGVRKSDKDRRISAGGTRQIKKMKTRKSNEGSRKSVLPLKSVKVPVEVDAKKDATGQKEKEIAKKRRRSSFVRGQTSEVVANKFESDDRSTKRRKR